MRLARDKFWTKVLHLENGSRRRELYIAGDVRDHLVLSLSDADLHELVRVLQAAEREEAT